MIPQNLLVLISDEHNATMMGCAGRPLAKTPNLDALAARGTRFVDAYTTCPILACRRARAVAPGALSTTSNVGTISFAFDGWVKRWGHRLEEAGICVESIG